MREALLRLREAGLRKCDIILSWFEVDLNKYVYVRLRCKTGKLCDFFTLKGSFNVDIGGILYQEAEPQVVTLCMTN